MMRLKRLIFMKFCSNGPRRGRVVAVLSCALALGLSLEQTWCDEVTTLNGAIERSLALDPVIRKTDSDIREARGFEREMKSSLLPQLRLEGSGGFANRDRSIDGVSSGGDDLFSRQIGLIGEQLIWDDGFHWYRWKDAEKRAEGKEMLERAQRETTAFGTVEAYLAVILARQQIELAKANLEVHRKVKDLAVDRANAAGNEADVELASARYSLAETLVEERELALAQAESLFLRFVGVRPPKSMKAPSVPSIDSLEAIDSTRNFHYQAAIMQRQAAELAKEAVESRYSPRFLFRGTGSVGEDVLGIRGEDNEVSALIVVQWDLFESGRKKGLMEQALADIDRQTAVIDETIVLLEQDIQARWADYATSRERIGILKKYEEELERTVELYEEQFELGTRPLLSVLDIQNEKIGAAIRLADDEAEFALLGYRLLFFGGELIRSTLGESFLETPVNEIEPEVVHPSLEEIPRAGESSSEKRRFRPFGFLRKKH